MRNKIWLILRNITIAKWRKIAFIKQLPKKASVLDVGCGNGGPSRFKIMRPDLYYVGIDVGDYNNTSEDIQMADEYIVTSPESFAKRILELGQRFDAVVSSHNLEHCYHPEETLMAICEVLKPGGVIFLAFSSEESVHFPKRNGTLNFYDDSTHIWIPKWDVILQIIQDTGMEVLVCEKNYKPPLLFLMGMLLEPVSAWSKKVLVGTWALYGFESIIWAKRKNFRN